MASRRAYEWAIERTQKEDQDGPGVGQSMLFGSLSFPSLAFPLASPNQSEHLDQAGQINENGKGKDDSEGA